MGQTNSENERKHTGDKAKRMGTQTLRGKIVAMHTKAAERKKEKTAKNAKQQKEMKTNS